MKINKAVILAAGFGTRMLPATKAVPKEMLNLVDKPAIQYIAEEIAGAGIENILIILSRGKTILEDHFDRSPDLEGVLLEKNNKESYNIIRDISNLANITYVRQQEMLGTGNAVMYARGFSAGEPFLLAYADDVFICKDPAAAQVCRIYEEFGKGVVAMKEVPAELVMKYSSLDVKTIRDNIYAVSDMIEKPAKEEIISNFSILGRCVLPPSIFEILERIPRGAGNEFQVTDAMKELARSEGMLGVDFTGKRYDMGNKLEMLKAIVEVGTAHEEIGSDFRAYLKDFADTL